jgi:hypothetical protein
MSAKVRKIEVDAKTADLLEARAARLGLSVSALLADLASQENAPAIDFSQLRAGGEEPWSRESLEEDARRFAEFADNRMGAPWDEVQTWIQSWGKPNELPRPKPRKL